MCPLGSPPAQRAQPALLGPHMPRVATALPPKGCTPTSSALALQGEPRPAGEGPGPHTLQPPPRTGKPYITHCSEHTLSTLRFQLRGRTSPPLLPPGALRRSSREGNEALLHRRTRPLPPPPTHSPFPPPLCPSPLLPEFWFELVSGSNHHIPQAAGAEPGAGAGALPPGRVWEWGGGDSAALEGKGRSRGQCRSSALPPSPPMPQCWNLPNYGPHPISHPSRWEARCKLPGCGGRGREEFSAAGNTEGQD